MGQGVNLALEGALDHLLLAGIDNFFESLRAAGGLLVNLRHRRFIALVDKNAVQPIQKIVSGRAINRPVLGQGFIAGENFLRDHVDRATRLNPLEILLRVP